MLATEHKREPGATVESRTGAIFNIERHALHDGPGIRTLVFLKGCPLRCSWCSNPEGQAIKSEIISYAERCTGCLSCVGVCPAHAIRPEGAHVATDRTACTGCGSCVEVCSHRARSLAGRPMSIAEVLEVVRKDEVFYRHSQGGVTVSGGEPLAQIDFLEGLLTACRGVGIHTAVETCGSAPWDSFERLIDTTDLFLYDLKSLDDDKHRLWTGVGNRGILENLAGLAARSAEMIVRVPVVPGFNFTLKALAAIVAFVEDLGSVREIHLLPYHRLGTVKYRALGRSYGLTHDTPVSVSMLHALVARIPTKRVAIRIDV